MSQGLLPTEVDGVSSSFTFLSEHTVQSAQCTEIINNPLSSVTHEKAQFLLEAHCVIHEEQLLDLSIVI